MLHDGKGQHCPSDQSSQDSQHDADHVVVTNPHHGAHIVHLPIDGNLQEIADRHTWDVQYLLLYVNNAIELTIYKEQAEDSCLVVSLILSNIIPHFTLIFKATKQHQISQMGKHVQPNKK